ncbi:YjaG family protein [Ralstonia solanacearum]|uniref:DUF416 family protein n=1 Tax=Ralstonia solanacearum TaxID=305 RepID=UPI001FF8B05A|nr:DUF416 family protein [Ralstonia solanacearum]MDB0529433.1 YjaG family protein [Ralstonia solanacearum]
MTEKILEFSEDVLREHLAAVPIEKVLAFSASCAELLLPAYDRYANKASLPGDVSRVYRNALDMIWSFALGMPVKTRDLEQQEKICLAAIPAEEDAWAHGELYSEEAGTAVTLTIRAALSHDVQEAVWAARCVYEALDDFVGKLERVNLAANKEEAILAHPLIQGEFVRQQHELAQLEAANTADQARVISELRERSKTRALHAFGASNN